MRISDWSSDVCSSDLAGPGLEGFEADAGRPGGLHLPGGGGGPGRIADERCADGDRAGAGEERKSVVEGKSVSVRVDLGGRRIIKKKKSNNHLQRQQQVT